MSVGVTDNKNVDGVNFVAPDGGWGWIIVLSSLLIHLIMDGITYAFGQFLKVFVDDFNASYQRVSVIHGLLPAVTLMCGPIGSILTNRYGCRLTTIVGAIIATIGFVLSCFVKNLLLLYVTIGLVVGVGFGLVYVPAIVSVGYYFEKRRSLAMGIAVCGAGIGTFVFAPLNRFLLDKYDWEGAFLIKAGIVFNICVLATVMIPVAIEPSEILKRKRKLEKSIQVQKTIVDKTENKDGLNEKHEKNSYLKVPIDNNFKTMVESMPSVFSESKPDDTRMNVSAQNLNDTEFFKSLPTLAEAEIAKTHEDALLKSYSSLNFLATMRSLKNINDPTDNGENLSNKNITETKKIIIANENAAQNEENKTFDIKILFNVLFLFFSISNFLTSLGFNAPYIYINDQAVSHGIEQTKADILLQTIGISNMIGRIVLGFLSDFKWVNRLYLYSTVITICGVATVIEPFLKTFPLLMIYAIVFGATSGGYVSLTSLLLVDLLGLGNLSNAFGILLVFQGIATAIGPTIAGAMRDAFQSYVVAFVFIGSMIGISGFMCFFLPLFPSYKKTKKMKLKLCQEAFF